MAIPEEKPHWMNYVGHIFLGIISGLIVYFYYRNKNRSAANWHLVHSLWLPILPYIVIFGVLFSAVGIHELLGL